VRGLLITTCQRSLPETRLLQAPMPDVTGGSAGFVSIQAKIIRAGSASADQHSLNNYPVILP
jgi:hypothetical protein